MRRPRPSTRLLLGALTALTTLTTLIGCQSQTVAQQKATPTRWDYSKEETVQAPQPKSEPAKTGWPTRTSGDTTLCTTMAFPTGDWRTSALGIEKCVPREVRLGQSFDYDLVVTNLTGASLDDVTVTDEATDNFKHAKSTPPATVKATVMEWQLGSLKPHETRVIHVTGSATNEQTINSCAAATYDSAVCASIPVVSPKLRLSMTGPAEVLKCDDIVYNFEVTNTGTGFIPNVKISDMLASGLNLADGRKTDDIMVGTLTAGQARQFSAKVKADKAGKYESKAVANGDGGITSESTSVTTTVREPVLAVDVTCPGKQFIGRPMDYQLSVTNNGDGVAKDTIVEAGVPTGAQFVSATEGGKMVGSKATWSIGVLQPKATKTFTMRLNPATLANYAVSVTAKAYCAAPVNDSCQSDVTGIPAILLEVVDVDDPIKVGDSETYIITVTNQGSAPDTNIKIVCQLEENQQYTSSTGSTSGTVSGSTITFAPLPTLAAKDKATFKVVVKNIKAGDVRFKAVMTSDQLTRPVEETEATRVYE